MKLTAAMAHGPWPCMVEVRSQVASDQSTPVKTDGQELVFSHSPCSSIMLNTTSRVEHTPVASSRVAHPKFRRPDDGRWHKNL